MSLKEEINRKKTEKYKNKTNPKTPDHSQKNILTEKHGNDLNKKTPWVFYLIIAAIPILFFVLLEILLRIFNYGINTTQWVEVVPGKLMLNTNIASRYFFSTKNVPYSNQDIFDKVKTPNSFRIFVLGESSAAGYPYMPVGAFSDYLRTRLGILYPDRKIEVVNISMTAINTYALRDMFPGVLEQKPDLVLIYTGHNEYYGALGVGSMESVGSNPVLVNFILSMNKFKTVELLRNFMGSVTKMISSKNPSEKGGTLMSKIARDQYIVYGSKEYKAGLNQFEYNMKAILKMANEKCVPVILGTLISNLKDQPPFISLKVQGQPEAASVFAKAKEELTKGNFKNAQSLFRKAKDLDGIRFRAPEDINLLIRSIGKEFASPVVDIDSAFCSISPDKIVGDNLMTDHLHPTLSGYQLIGKLYYDMMKKVNLLPKTNPVTYRDGQLDSLTLSCYKFSRLDSVIAATRIIALKNDWPFTDSRNKRPVESLVQPKNYIDSLAFMIVFGNFPWEEAHRKAADWYLKKNNFNEFQKIIDVLIDRYPVIIEYYRFLTEKLLEKKRYDEAYAYLTKSYSYKHDAYSSKWLGIIDLSRQKPDQAVNYLKESLQFNSSDAQVLYNLSGAYINKNDYKHALEIINRCLENEPDFPGARELKAQLTSALAQ